MAGHTGSEAGHTGSGRAHRKWQDTQEVRQDTQEVAGHTGSEAGHTGIEVGLTAPQSLHSHKQSHTDTHVYNMYLHLQCDGTNVAVKVCYTHALGRRGHRLVVVRAAVVAPPPPPSRGTVFPSTLLGVQCRLEVSLGCGEVVHS